jgi:hypothetical protein
VEKLMEAVGSLHCCLCEFTADGGWRHCLLAGLAFRQKCWMHSGDSDDCWSPSAPPHLSHHLQPSEHPGSASLPRGTSHRVSLLATLTWSGTGKWVLKTWPPVEPK